MPSRRDFILKNFPARECTVSRVMVCMDGFVLTHAFEPLEASDQETIDAFLPAFQPRQVLDPDDPMTIGAMVGPEAFDRGSLPPTRQADPGARRHPARRCRIRRAIRSPAAGGLLDVYRGADAETIIVALGSVNGTLAEVIDEQREQARV